MVVLHGHKGLKDALLLLRRDAPARVADPQVHVRRGHLRPQGHLALLGELARVAQQVEQNLAQAHGIGADERQTLGQIQPPLHGRVRVLPGNAVEGFFQQRARIDQFQGQVQLVDLGPRKVEQVIDHAQLVFGVRLDIAEFHRAGRARAFESSRSWV